MRAGSPGEFQFRSHDNFKISERASLWNWKSRDIGGRSALDYLIRVEGRSFVEAVFIPSEEAFLIRTQRRGANCRGLSGSIPCTKFPGKSWPGAGCLWYAEEKSRAKCPSRSVLLKSIISSVPHSRGWRRSGRQRMEQAAFDISAAFLPIRFPPQA